MSDQLQMNIYLIQEDGEFRCWQAVSADMAIVTAECAFVREHKNDWDLDEHPREYWNRTIFESCALIGELANPAEDNQ